MFGRFGATPGEGDSAAGFVSQPRVGPCPFIGKIETIAGTCSLIRAGRIIVEIEVGDPVCRGDVIKTAADGRVGIRFVDGTAFSLSNDARMMLREFAYGGDSPSALFDVTRGAFAFIAGEMAKAGHLGIDTPVASIRGRTRTGGVGTLTLSALIFAVMEEARAESPGNAFLDDGTITYNGVFELVTKEANPRHILVDNPAETIVLHRIGSSISADQIINTAAQMAQLQAAQQDALHVFALGLAQGPTVTGPGGSGGPPGFEIPSLFVQPINFTPPPGGGLPTGPTGLTAPAFNTNNALFIPPPPPPPPHFDASNTVPASISATEGVNKAIAGISISDPDATGNVTTTLSVLHGTLTVLAGVPGGLTSGDISNNGSGTVTLTGTVAEINATLAAANGLVYREQGDHTSDPLTVATQDQGTTPLLTATSTVPITVTEVLDASNTVPASISATEGVNKAIAGISISDPDATGNVTTTLSVLHGTLTVLAGSTGRPHQRRHFQQRLEHGHPDRHRGGDQRHARRCQRPRLSGAGRPHQRHADRRHPGPGHDAAVDRDQHRADHRHRGARRQQHGTGLDQRHRGRQQGNRRHLDQRSRRHRQRPHHATRCCMAR